MVTPEILSAVLGRDRSLFEAALAQHDDQLREHIAGSRVLVIGAAGSIGSAFVKVLAPYRPTALHLVDLSENNLVRGVRELHAEGRYPPGEFATCAIGYDEVEFEAYLEACRPFDHILNFAALKHVRSERDPYTAMRLLRVNVIANQALIRRLSRRPPRGFFCVSSDKAVNPASLMGASKAFMERVGLARSAAVPFTSARFANVAFSEGSLLQSFCQRLEGGHALAGPSDVRRYFISHQEAGELCLLAGFVGGNREIFTPELEPGRDLKTFPEIAEIILHRRGLKLMNCASEAEAIEQARRRQASDSWWPSHFAPSNTPGEKPFEEFHGAGEAVTHGRLPNIAVVTEPRAIDLATVDSAVEQLEEWRRSGRWDRIGLLELVRRVVPEFQSREGAGNLDQKL
jgi:FlaA1/EpsC-like NDP-sugar epimerase